MRVCGPDRVGHSASPRMLIGIIRSPLRTPGFSPRRPPFVAQPTDISTLRHLLLLACCASPSNPCSPLPRPSLPARRLSLAVSPERLPFPAFAAVPFPRNARAPLPYRTFSPHPLFPSSLHRQPLPSAACDFLGSSPRPPRPTSVLPRSRCISQRFIPSTTSMCIAYHIRIISQSQPDPGAFFMSDRASFAATHRLSSLFHPSNPQCTHRRTYTIPAPATRHRSPHHLQSPSHRTLQISIMIHSSFPPGPSEFALLQLLSHSHRLPNSDPRTRTRARTYTVMRLLRPSVFPIIIYYDPSPALTRTSSLHYNRHNRCVVAWARTVHGLRALTSRTSTTTTPAPSDD
ncbi:hypothetical protein FKP32DRAFT_1283472 [Trametes sanguinea]|nr:hypothetical protein FKP32DRAFT_1283472 [Trametes sanguinea]